MSQTEASRDSKVHDSDSDIEADRFTRGTVQTLDDGYIPPHILQFVGQVVRVQKATDFDANNRKVDYWKVHIAMSDTRLVNAWTMWKQQLISQINVAKSLPRATACDLPLFSNYDDDDKSITVVAKCKHDVCVAHSLINVPDVGPEFSVPLNKPLFFVLARPIVRYTAVETDAKEALVELNLCQILTPTHPHYDLDPVITDNHEIYRILQKAAVDLSGMDQQIRTVVAQLPYATKCPACGEPPLDFPRAYCHHKQATGQFHRYMCSNAKHQHCWYPCSSSLFDNETMDIHGDHLPWVVRQCREVRAQNQDPTFHYPDPCWAHSAGYLIGHDKYRTLLLVYLTALIAKRTAETSVWQSIVKDSPPLMVGDKQPLMVNNVTSVDHKVNLTSIVQGYGKFVGNEATAHGTAHEVTSVDVKSATTVVQPQTSVDAAPPVKLSAQFSALSYNIQLDGLDAPSHKWSDRRLPVAQILVGNDVLLLQEVSHDQFQHLQQDLGDKFAFVGINTVTGKNLNSLAPNTQEGLVIGWKHGVFVQWDKPSQLWFSDTPQVAGSQSFGQWKSQFPKMLHALILMHLDTNKPVLVVNSHFSHEESKDGVNPRLEAGKLELQFIDAQINGYNNKRKQTQLTVVSAGDRNLVLPRDDAVVKLYHDSKSLQDADLTGCRSGLRQCTFLGYEDHPHANPYDVKSESFTGTRNLDKVFFSKDSLVLHKFVVSVGLYDHAGRYVQSIDDPAAYKHHNPATVLPLIQKRSFASDHAALRLGFFLV